MFHLTFEYCRKSSRFSTSHGFGKVSSSILKIKNEIRIMNIGIKFTILVFNDVPVYVFSDLAHTRTSLHINHIYEVYNSDEQSAHVDVNNSSL